MCGIAAVYPSCRELIDEVLPRLRERGPDQDAVSDTTLASLGASRLKITDMERGDQPLVTSSGSTVIIFNGAIYNAFYLREAFNLQTLTQNDAEVVACLYEVLGDEVVNYLDGMYAFIIADLRRQRLVAANDSFGIKPLHWARAEGHLLFSSTVSSLPVNFQKTVRRFPSGVLWASDGTVRKVVPYHGQSCGELVEELRRAVRSQVPAEVPWGCMLSGGVDSALVTAMCTELRGSSVIAYTAGTLKSDDFNVARRFAKFVDLDHRPIVIDRMMVEQAVVQVIEATANYDPLTVMSGVGTLLVADQARRDGVKVLLSGEGADELFGGYDVYQKIPTRDLNSTLLRDQSELGATECLRLDRCTGACGIEARVPFLSAGVVQLSRSIGPLDKILPTADRRTFNKIALRRAAELCLPNWVAHREKVPFFEGAGLSGMVAEVAESWLERSSISRSQDELRCFGVHSTVARYLFELWFERFGEITTSFEDLCIRGLTRRNYFRPNGL